MQMGSKARWALTTVISPIFPDPVLRMELRIWWVSSISTPSILYWNPLRRILEDSRLHASAVPGFIAFFIELKVRRGSPNLSEQVTPPHPSVFGLDAP